MIMDRRFQLLAIAVVAATASAAHGGSIGSAHAAHERLYQTLVSLRDDNPARFDRMHPFYGKLLSDPGDFAYWTARWQAAPARFEAYHPCLWRTLDGGSVFGGFPPTPIVPPIPPVIPPYTPGGPPNFPIVPPSCPWVPHVCNATVPEPASLSLIGVGTTLFFLATRWTRRRKLKKGGDS